MILTCREIAEAIALRFAGRELDTAPDEELVTAISEVLFAQTRAAYEEAAQVCDEMAADTRRRFAGHSMPVDVFALEEAAATIRKLKYGDTPGDTEQPRRA